MLFLFLINERVSFYVICAIVIFLMVNALICNGTINSDVYVRSVLLYGSVRAQGRSVRVEAVPVHILSLYVSSLWSFSLRLSSATLPSSFPCIVCLSLSPTLYIISVFSILSLCFISPLVFPPLPFALVSPLPPKLYCFCFT